MAEDVVARPAELGAGRVVVVVGALYPHPVGQVGVAALVVERVPRDPGQHDAAVARLLDYPAALLVPRLQDQRELSLQSGRIGLRLAGCSVLRYCARGVSFSSR